MSQCIRFLGTLFLISLPEIVVSDITALRDVKFTQDYNKNEMPPSHDGKPLMVSKIFWEFNHNFCCLFCLWPIKKNVLKIQFFAGWNFLNIAFLKSIIMYALCMNECCDSFVVKYVFTGINMMVVTSDTYCEKYIYML